MADLNNFMNWWHSINEVLRAIGQPELRYGDARDFFKDAREREDLASRMLLAQSPDNVVADEWADDLAAAVIEQGRNL